MHKPAMSTAEGAAISPGARPEGVQLRARRSPRLIALGILLVVLGGLAAAAVYSANSDHRLVVAMARDVSRGTVLQADDLEQVEVAGGIAADALPAEQLTTLVGRHTLTDLPQGSFPQARHVGDDPLPAGQSLVGLRLPMGRIPVSPLPPGTRVAVVGVGEGEQQRIEGVVAAPLSPIDDGASFAVDLRVADADAPGLARLAATDAAALIVIGES
ncbi:MAG: SAF domain-containing protein [Arachnia sp.]